MALICQSLNLLQGGQWLTPAMSAAARVFVLKVVSFGSCPLSYSSNFFSSYSSVSDSSSPPFLKTPSRIPPLPHSFELPVLYKSKNFLIVDKPRDMRLTIGKLDDMSVESLIRDLRLTSCPDSSVSTSSISSPISSPLPAPFHPIGRLDFATSGVLIVALNVRAARLANLEVELRRVQKVYMALLHGHMPLTRIHCRAPICKPSTGAFEMRLAGERIEGKPCYSIFEPLLHSHYQGHPVTLAELRTVTGRRHQLRLHSVALGHPIVGDVTYRDDRRLDIVKIPAFENRRKEEKRRSLSSFPVSNADVGKVKTNETKNENNNCINGNNRVKEEELEKGDDAGRGPVDDAFRCFAPRLMLHCWKVKMKAAGETIDVVAKDCLSPLISLEPRNCMMSCLFDEGVVQKHYGFYEPEEIWNSGGKEGRATQNCKATDEDDRDSLSSCDELVVAKIKQLERDQRYSDNNSYIDKLLKY